MGPLFVSMMVVVANITGAGMIVPQVMRLHRVRGVDGVSAVWIGIGIALNLFWLAYGLDRGLQALIPVSGVSIVLYGVMAFLYLRIAGARAVTHLAVGFVGASSLPAAALAVGGWELGGIALGLAYTVQFSPAVWSAVTAPSLNGVAAGTWRLAWVEAAAWLTYGLVRADPAITLGGAGSGAMASMILVALAADRLPASRDGAMASR